MGAARNIHLVEPYPGMVGSVAGRKHRRPFGRREVRRCHRQNVG